MRRVFLISLVATLALASGAQVVDRVAATVNGRAILVSEVDDAARYSALLDGRAPETIRATDRAAALQQLIDQELIRQRISSAGLLPAADQEVATKAAALRRQLGANQDDGGWRALLARYGLSEADFATQLRRQLEQLRFIDMRFRPNAHIAAAEIEVYYRDQYVVKMRAAGAAEKPLADVRPQIEEILTQQQVDRQLDGWLQALRAEAAIRVLVNFADRQNVQPKAPNAQQGAPR
jgi:hypothetical protein